MRLRPTIWIATCLLLLAGAWLLWRAHNHRTIAKINPPRNVVATLHSTSTAPDLTKAETTVAANVAENVTATVKTNPFAYRLSNTSKTIAELTFDPHAILLQNALIDTSSSTNLSIPSHLRASGDAGAYIVQARTVMDASFRNLLQSTGAKIVSYIPNNAYLISASAAIANLLRAQPPVQAVIPYEPYYKFQDSLIGLASENLPLPAGTLLKLGLFNDNIAQTTKQIEQLGGKVLGQDTSPFGAVLIVQPPQNWTALATLPPVGIVEPFRQRVHANDLSRAAVGVAADSITATNYMGLTGKNVIVAVDDSGVDINHPDFMTGGSAPLRILLNDTNDGIDTDGHGTHVAGIIAGDGTESMTVSNAEGSINPGTTNQFRGMAPLAQILSLSFSDFSESDVENHDIARGGGDVSDAFFQQTAARTNALISNNSWNYGGDSEYDLAAASYDAATRDAIPEMTGSQPVTFVFSAGNQGGGADDGSGGFPDTILSPATGKNVITVGAVEEYRYITNSVTNADLSVSQPWLPMTDSGYSPFGSSSPQVADFSSRGNVGIGIEGQFGRYKPDVVAPGTFVVSTRSSQWATNVYYNPTNSNITSITDLLETNAQTDPPFQFFVFNNTVSVTITATSSVTNNLPIYLWQGGASPVLAGTDSVTIPNGSLSLSPLNSIWQCAVSNTTAGNLPYTITVNVQTTNDLGNYYQVLQGLNDSIGSSGPNFPNGYYRYETGTSMSAASVSGTLALMGDYFINQLGMTNPLPSPALLKALLINGARPTGSYNYQVQNSLNYEGWGQINLPNSIPESSSTNVEFTSQTGQFCETFFQDQSPTNALATGDTQTFYVTLDTTNTDVQFADFHFTLAWTDPPGNPVAAIKLVNNLDLVVSNMDTGDVYFGNDIPAGSIYNNDWSPDTVTNAVNVADSINNIEQVILPGILNNGNLTEHYAVTVIGKAVNVNAVYAQSNNIVQDYALVMHSDIGEPDVFSVANGGISNAPTSYQDITYVTTTNQPLFDQMVGASSPLLGTNQIDLGTNLLYGTNGLITLGQTNQWHFYIITNNGASDFTNAAFITFLPDTLALPRTGVYADSDANSTRPEADIDLYVSTDSNIMNLDPTVISNCVHGAGIVPSTIFNGASLGRGGTEFVTETNSKPGKVYYVGVQSQDQMASEYAFIPIFTDIPFGGSNSNGDQFINGLNVPVPIPDGSPSHPGTGYVFLIGLQQEEIQRVVVTNVITHQNSGDLVGVLSHSDQKGGNVSVTLNSHDELPNPPGPYTLVYDDSGQNDIAGTRTTDGPGSLNDFVGGEALGVWILSEVDNSQTQTGQVDNVQLFVEKHQNPTKGITVSIPPGSWYYTYVDVPTGYTNLELFGTNLPPQSTPAIQMYLRYNSQPDANDYDLEADLTNAGPTGWGNEISDGPPLPVGRYFVGLYNGSLASQTVYLLAQLNGSLENIPPLDYTTNGPPLPDDAVSSSTIYVPATNLIASVNVGFVVQHPRISDLSFTLISPTGQRILLMEDRGGLTATNAGHLNVLTNYFGTATSGNANASTNIIGPVPTQGTLLIDYNFYSLPDEMVVYYDGQQIFDSGEIGGIGTFTIPPANGIPYGPGFSTNIVIVMNPGNNTNSTTLWEYTPSVVFNDYNYLTFTEDTNLTQTPIKYAVPPFDLTDEGANFILSDFELATNGDYLGPTTITDAFGGWTVPTNILSSTNFFTNEVSVVTDPHDSFVGDNLNGTNILALANGYIVRTNTLALERTYSISYQYRGPGISGWWRGEGDASDSADPERLGQNGSLIGRFDFPAGEVGQAFEFEDAGEEFEFAGTNTYVQIRQQPIYTLTVTNDGFPPVLLQSSPLDVGVGGGLTVEGWINPTNIAQQMPLVEWLARVPTNGSDTNLMIIAGPFLDRDTSHYYYLLAPTNWTTSETWAEQLGGHLATVDTANEENWIYDNFANYDFTNHNLWIGLTNNHAVVYGWVGGETNVAYTNWATGQPNSLGAQSYTVLLGPTNATPGLWALANKVGQIVNTVSSTNIFGVVEVPDIQTNGVQLWISVTNYNIGMTNGIFDGSGNLYSNGCIYANLVDTSDSNHIIFSQPLLIQTNVYQHIALTYDTNSGIANLFYNGTNVATTNFGGIHFTPKTTGDVLLGKDMSRETNNYYGGTMDEMSIYNRALSDAEILAIYNDSAQTTNREVGKFDPAQSPPDNLAEAQVSLGENTNIIFGNNNWQTGGFTFVAQTNSMVMQLLGLEPGMLLDNFTVSETPIGNLYYFPETSLDDLKSTDPQGNWKLEVWDNRTGAGVTNALISWQLEFILASNPPPVALNPEEPASLTVPPNGWAYLTIAVPDWANFATNILVSASSTLNVYFNQTNPPTGSSPGDSFMFSGTSGSETLSATSVPTNFVSGQTYYVGLQNPSSHAVSATFEVDFDITSLSNGVPVTEFLNTNQSGRYFSFDVDSNAYEATFQLLQVSNNVDLVVRKGFPLPTLDSDDYGSFNVSNADENIFVLTNSSPVPLSAGRWYLGAFKRTANVPANFTVLAKELTNSLSTAVSIIPLTNGVPFSWTAGPGAALTNFFLFAPTNTITPTETNYIQAIRFELYSLSGNGDLTVQTDTPPFAPPFFESSQQPGTIPELITIRTNNVLTNLATAWYLGVPNNETNEINYTIIAAVETNGYFSAFPGAEGAGGGALGGRFGDVYHVIYTDDSGPGTLRDAVTSSNRTVVFDVSGPIFLKSPLVITNSFLTIAGQTAPGDGITVAGNMTVVTNAHDVVIRDVRFRSGIVGGLFSTGFEQSAAGDYTNGQKVASWTVVTNQVSIVSDAVNANQGSNFLALANGTISNSLATMPGQTYALTFAYRGPGIVGWWRGERDYKDNVNGYNGSVTVGSVLFTNAEVGQGFSFNGNTNRLVVSDAPALNFGPGADFSIDGWVGPLMPPPYPTTGIMTIVDHRYSPNSSVCQGYEFDVRSPIGGGPPATLFFHMSDSIASSGTGWWAGGSDLRDGQLHHVAVTVARNSTTGGHMYVDGVQIMQFDPTTEPGDLTPSPTQPFRIGNHADPTYSSYFNGSIDELSLYKRALSASEIKAIYQAKTNGKSDTIEYNSSPELSLSKAYFTIPGISTNIIWGENTNWQTATITFTATNSITPLLISGASPGMLLDALNVVPQDSLQLNTVSNVVADHISATWSTNADVEILNSSNVTVQWSVISDSLNATNMLHGYGARLRYGGGFFSLHHNLFADNAYASPRLGDNLQLDFVNNVIYGWGTNAGFSANDSAKNPGGFTNSLNYICNYLIASTNSLTNTIAFWSGSTNTWIFQTNNFIDYNTNGILDGDDIGWRMFTNITVAQKFSRPFPTVLPSIDEAFLAYERVLDFAGPDMDKRDLVDSNIVANVRTQSGKILNSVGTLPNLNSSLPYLDTDQDGIPDFWEITFGEPPFTPSATQDRDGDGYTDLEEYNNWLAGPHALTVANTPVGVDLQQLFGGTGILSFSVTNAVRGFVYLTNVLNYTNVAGAVFAVTNTSAFSNSFAIFTPTNNFGGGTNYGYASFGVFTTNNNTIAHFGPVAVSVVVSKVPVRINSNMPPVIVTLANGILDPTNTGGSQFSYIPVPAGASGLLVYVTNIVGGPLDLALAYNNPQPSLSHYDYLNTNSSSGYESIFVGPNSTPTPLTNGDWYAAVVNVSPSGAAISYDIGFTTYGTILPPLFTYPTNNVFSNIETTPFTLQCQATDTNSPPLPLTFSIVTNVLSTNLLNELDTNLMAIDPNTGIISWTPDEAQGPTTNSVAVRVSNGYSSVTNTFTVIVEESNLPPFWTPNVVTNYTVNVQSTLVMVDAATDMDIPLNTLAYSMFASVTNVFMDINGIITWTPTAVQERTYILTNVVTDTNQWAVNAQSLSNTNYVFVTVLPPLSIVGGLPQTNTVGAGDIDWFTVNVPTNADWATNRLIFATNLPVNILFTTNAPPTTVTATNLMLDITSGVSILGTNTAPTNIVMGGTYYLGVQNTNSVAVGYALEVDFHFITATVPTNVLVISSITHTNIGGTNGFLLIWLAPTNDIFQVQEADDLASPIAWNTFSNIVSYTSLTPTNGIGLFEYFDNGLQYPFGPTRFYRLLLLQATNTLTLPNQTNYIANVSQPLAVTNTATDSNGSAILNYQLVSFPTPSTSSVIGATNGIISWTPGMNDVGGAFKFTTIVFDNGLPPASASNYFTVFVLPAPSFSSAITTSTNVALAWLAPSNDLFDVEWATNLTPPVGWTLFSNGASPGIITFTNGAFGFTDTNVLLMTKFYRLVWLPLP